MGKLSKLTKKTTELSLPAPYDGETYPVYLLNFSEWNEVAAAVPVPEFDEMMTDAVENGKKVLVPDKIARNEARAEYSSEIMIRRLAYSMLQTGEYDELNGKSLDEAVEIVREIDAAALSAMAKWLDDRVRTAQAKIVERAERFPESD